MYTSSSGWLKNRSVYVLAFWLALLLITLFDIIALNDRISVTQIFIYLSLLSVALSIPIKPRLCGWLFIILDVLFIALTPYPVGVLGYVCVAVFFLWGWGKLKLDSAIGALILTAGFLVGSSFIVMGAVMLVLMLATAFNAGYMMKRYMGERDAALSRLWEAELQQVKVAQRLRDGLAMQLHDSLASSLSVIAKLSEALREQLSDNAELAPKVDLLGEQARASLSEIREIIQLLDNPDGAPAQSLDIASELDRVKSVAEASKIDFKVEFDNDDLNLVSTETEKLLMAFLREATTNLLKYAAPASKANLSISCNENSIEVMAKNYYLDVVRDAVLTSGKGLKTIRKKIESAGGQLDVWTVDSCWYVHAEIPLVKGDSSARR